MAVKIWNLSKFRMVVPGVGGPALRSGEARVYTDVQYDALVNNGNVQDLLLGHKIKIKNMDDMDVQFAGGWNESPHMTIGTHEYWIDASGDTRVVDGTPTSDTDGTVLGSGGGVVAEPIYADTIPSASRTFAQVRSAFFGWFKNQGIGDWDSLFKYCYWSFGYSYADWTPFQQFATTNDMFTWMEANLPTSGGSYTQSIKFQLMEHVDTEDTFPQTLVHRNSLTASILGKHRYNRRRQAYGVASAFNAPQYYTNFYNELAQRFVQADTGVLPATNNDGAVWHTLRTRSKHGLMKVGATMYVSTPGARAAVWNSSAANWVSPAPTGAYAAQAPFLLMEWRRNKILQLSNPPSSTEWGRAATESVSALVFPLVHTTSPQYRAYALYPYNYDSFATERFDTAEYDLVLKLVYRNTSRPTYRVLDNTWYTVGSDGEHMMWSHWVVVTPSPLWLTSVLADKAPGSTGRNPDSNTYPDKVYVARRNKTTGARSQWYPLYSIRRRTPYSPYRLVPARYR